MFGFIRRWFARRRLAGLNEQVIRLYQQGRYPEAVDSAQDARDIARQHLGDDHPDFATTLNNLAELYKAMGNYAQAEALYRQATEIDRESLGENHHHYATDLNNLASLYDSMGNYAQAEPLYCQATEIRRVSLGEDHPDFAASLNNLAGLCIATERAEQGFTLMYQAATIDDRLIGQVFSISSDSQRAAFLKQTQARLESFLSLVRGHGAHASEVVQAALELVLRRKAITAEVQAAQRDAVLGGKYPHIEPQLRQWSTLRLQIARKTLAGPGPEGLPAHQGQLADWHTQRDRLEVELARGIPEMNLERKLRAADRRAVALVSQQPSIVRLSLS